MSQEVMKQTLHSMQTKQQEDVAQLAKYKALMMEIDERVRERAVMIKLMEAAINPDKRNTTLRDILG